MADILHGVYIYELPTSIVTPITVDSAIQVAVGTAPINLGEVDDPLTVKIAYDYDEAVSKIGYSGDLMRFTLCQVLKSSFEIYGVAPVIFINVLDPKRHSKTVSEYGVPIAEGVAHVEAEGILIDSLKVKAGEGDAISELEPEVDYIAYFEKDGTLMIEAMEGGAITDAVAEIRVSYKQLDTDKVTDQDILDGIRKIEEVFPRFDVVPGQLVCPGWSHKPAIYMAMSAAVEKINGCFNCIFHADIDTDEAPTYDSCNEVKNKNNYFMSNSNVLWPMARIGDDIYYQSALWGAHTAYRDYVNQGVPFVSPSNKEFKISGTCDKHGKEIILDFAKANLLNGQGINTAINFKGWRTWGNYTGVYPSRTDVKDVFLAVRRMFLWHGNTFILTYFQKVDDPMRRRLIEEVVDSENIRGNGYKAREQIAEMKIEYKSEKNPITALLAGTIRFTQIFTPFPPAQAIENELEFDPYALQANLEG